jgi:signal transduction histidine kinase
MKRQPSFLLPQLRGFCLLFICLLAFVPLAKSQQNEKAPILIVSSYNPEAASLSSYISNFINEYKLRESDRSIVIENMNCKALSESPQWVGLMHNILHKFATMKIRPAVIIMLGQEAFTSYLSQPVSSLCGIPVMCGMVSLNTIRFPQHSFNPATIELPCEDVSKLAKQYNVVGGFLYRYGVRNNLALVKKYYPDTKTIAFITDNSCGGLCLHSYINMRMKTHPEYRYVSLDGRQNTVYSMINKLQKLGDHSALILGTWRVDKNEGYFMHNSVYLMKDANPKLPVFSMSTIGIGDWALGGYTPNYRNTGKDLAGQVYDYIHKKGHGSAQLVIIPMKYVFDAKALKSHHFELDSLPAGTEMINKEESFWHKNKSIIIPVSIAFLVLSTVIIVLIYLLWKTNKLKRALEESQDELVTAKERAEEANKLKSAFLANMSHEIRTPLNAIVGFSNLLTTNDLSEEERNEFSTIIQKNSDLMLHLINDILDLSRLESNHIDFFFKKIDVVDLCKSALMTSKVAHKADLDYRFESRFNSRIEIIDSQRIQQVLNNLLGNAYKFTKEGSITLSFDVDEKKRRLYFTVSDTGCGISPENREKIFERFEKLNEYVQGTGLGLSICRVTIERFGGKIWVDPSYDKGARFIFYIPIQDKETEETE